MENSIRLKQKIYLECVNYIELKLEQIHKAVDALQESANRETKSSMGDKYETGRAAIQLEIEKYSQQFNEFTSLKKTLYQINPEKNYDSVQPGCLVFTNQGIYFIAISAGEIEIDEIKYYTISLASPLGKELHKRKKGERFIFRDKNFEIESVI